MSDALDAVVEEIYAYMKPESPPYDKARAVHEWIVSAISYDDARLAAAEGGRDDGNPYRPEQTLARKAGICCDMTVLYIALAKKLDVRAQYARVSIDHRGERVRHACAEVDVGHRKLLADPAYKLFDVRHKRYEIVREWAYWSSVPERLPLPRVAAAGLLLAFCTGLVVIGANASCARREDPLSAQDTAAGVEFRTPHGALAYAYAPDAVKTMKDALLLHEAKNGELSGQAMLRLLVRTDADKNGVISAFEAQRLLAEALAHYGR
jgi:hypothetical protein